MTSLQSPHVIQPGQMLPDVLRAYPHLRPVFDQYSLRGCGGANGPAESIAYFAQAHGVNIEQLLHELNRGLRDPSSIPAGGQTNDDSLDHLADTIYRRFFKAGVAVILSAGAVWGAVLLLRIGLGRSFTAISIHDINAHGHAQIFGWVGLFVMGFAYQAFPRMRHTSLWRPDLANFSFYLMVFGVMARAVGEPLHEWPLMRELAVSASFAEIAAIAMFITVLLRTFQRSRKPYATHDAYILAALAFFFVQAIYDLALMYATTTAPSRAELLRIIATYQAPLRDLQIHGFALLIILGVGVRMFPALFGFAAPSRALVRSALCVLIAAVLGEAGCFLLMRRSGNYAWAMPMYASMLALAGASIALTFRWGLLAHPAAPDRSSKFVRAAVAWLHTSMILLILAPLYMRTVLPGTQNLSDSGQHAAAIGFSHAYYGAVRHAITVGFISLVILGMAAKVVPTLNGIDIRRLSSLWVPFALINVGCFMRVAFQIATDFGEWAFPVAGISGLLEVSGIAVWGLHLWRIMNGWKPAEQDSAERPRWITADDKIGQIVEWYPQTLPLLIGRGFAPLANPVMRRTMAKAVSVRMAAAHHQLDLEDLLVELNTAVGAGASAAASSSRAVSLPVLQHA
ncbi:NnrS protein [Phycisphaerae bacterium RAS2]|nr:NnrS protein [Phycisphaerae bacterium RAS2]